uniref:Uncharacterized protein n=1 Tax=Amphimedon queenslandica TaxID=400682 RepID=A0A1X7V0M7_AMPQE
GSPVNGWRHGNDKYTHTTTALPSHQISLWFRHTLVLRLCRQL